MIFGIGTDILRIARVSAALGRHGDRFAERILGPSELVTYHQRRAKIELRGVRFLATRFTAKEAFSKAIGLGMRTPMSWRAMEVSKLPSGKPGVLCHGALADFMQANRLTAHLTLTDEDEYAVAFAVVEQSP